MILHTNYYLGNPDLFLYNFTTKTQKLFLINKD